MFDVETFKKRFGGISELSFRNQRQMVVSSESVYAILRHLREDQAFDMLIDLTAVDYLEYPGATDRFGVVYFLLKSVSGERLTIKTFVNPPELELPSAYPLWRAADWLEREVYDMFGIQFAGHPNMRRILMPDEFTAFPLRKDYPIQGRGERHNFPVITRAES
jgi:NADH-quinone oxidoreductase subunit C